MVLHHRIGGRTAALLRRYPRIKRGEELRLYVTLIIQAEALVQSLIDGEADPRKLRALTESQRMIVDVGRSLGLIRAALRAATEPDAAPAATGDDDLSPAVRAMIGKER
jgi:hypothetical protein